MGTKLYKIQGKAFRLDEDLYKIVKLYGVTRKDIEGEYSFMQRITPGIKVMSYNHAAYSAIVKRSKGRSVWDL